MQWLIEQMVRSLSREDVQWRMLTGIWTPLQSETLLNIINICENWVSQLAVLLWSGSNGCIAAMSKRVFSFATSAGRRLPKCSPRHLIRCSMSTESANPVICDAKVEMVNTDE